MRTTFEPYALEHNEFGVITTLEKLRQQPPDVRAAWEAADTRTLYAVREEDPRQMELPLDTPKVQP